MAGVPEITPVEASNTNPAGNAGVTEYEVTTPPETVGIRLAIGLLSVKIFGDEYERDAGAASLTVITTPKLVLPPILDAVIVYVAVALVCNGLPEITPVDELRFSPLGKAGETV